MVRKQLIGPALIACLALLAAGSACGAESVTIESKYPGLSSGPLRTAAPGPVHGALLEAEGVKITFKDLNDAIAGLESPAKEQYRTYQFALLQELAVGKIIEAEARAWGEKNGVSGDELMRKDVASLVGDITVSDEEARKFYAENSAMMGKSTYEQVESAIKSQIRQEKGNAILLMRKYVASLVGEITVSDEEARKFYAENSAMMGKSTYEQVESAIKSYIRQERGNAILDKHVAGVGERHSVRISDIWAKMQYARWLRNPVEKARRSGKPSMVKFGSDSCPPCRLMAPVVKDLEKKFVGKLVVVDVDVEKEPVLGAHYGAASIPHTIYYDASGKQVSEVTGFKDRASVESELEKLGLK